jgi:hypothetical protein
MPDPAPSPVAEKFGGAFLLAAGALMLRGGVLTPLEEARARALEVSTTTAAAVLAPLALILGSCLLLLPPRTVWNFLSRPSLRNPATQQLTVTGWLLLASVLTPGLLLYVWLQWQLERQGYR